MRIVITKQGWFGQKFQAHIVTKEGIVFNSQIVSNLSKLEETIKDLQRDITKYITVYEDMMGD